MAPREDLYPTALRVVDRCRALSACTEEPGRTTRTFLSPPMREVHARVTDWMQSAGMRTHVDAAGNVRGVYPAAADALARPLIVGSHLDTVPNAGAFDGVLGVVLGIALVEAARAAALPFPIEVIGFSEEEGVRFGTPFIGSLARIGALDDRLLAVTDAGGGSVRDAIEAYGLDVSAIAAAAEPRDGLGYLEFHIEQGPVLDDAAIPVGVVDAIAGQSRLEVTFTGAAGHAGTTPMASRRDALAGAAAWIGVVEATARQAQGLVATVGRIEATPGATNVIPGRCVLSLDVRHRDDDVRSRAVETLLGAARELALTRGLEVTATFRLQQAATAMSPEMAGVLHEAVSHTGVPVRHMTSGAGHDAMVMARVMPAGMLFLRNPGGVSHHPDESVDAADVAVALEVGLHALDILAARVRTAQANRAQVTGQAL